MILYKVFSILFSLFLIVSCSDQGTRATNFHKPVPPELQRDFTTDFSRQAIDFDAILSGGPPKDGIPALMDPPFITVSEATLGLLDKDPVIALSIGGETMILPLRILTWHEIVNTALDGVPIAVTYCPLCNTSLVFDRRHQDRILDFGTTGRLHGSNLLMYDRQTESWWQQATGRGVFGEYTHKQLATVPSRVLSWGTASRAFPQALVLSEDTGYSRNYGENPYPGYDSPGNIPFLFQGEFRPGTDPVSRVLILGEEEFVRIPYSSVMRRGFLEITVDDTPAILIADKTTASALDTNLFQNAKINGSINAYSALLDGQTLSFQNQTGRIEDKETGSIWDASGLAVQGPLKGSRLEVIIARQSLDFSAYHFYREAGELPGPYAPQR
jgi:uncharacterized protein YbaR (Trm112 family)